MGLFDFLIRLLGGGSKNPPAPPRAPAARAPQSNWPQAGGEIRNPNQGTLRPEVSPPQPAPPAAPVRPAYQRPERREVTLQLDAAQFSPLPADQVRAQAMSTQFTGFFEFGRRDRIPSPIDPRTKLIDQAMVGQGLIDAEELVRIHQIGEEYDALRPEIVGAHRMAERAVQADREERARIKAEKKAAAERRKHEHAVRVERNRLTDIIHLGRGVSKGLADRRSNLEQLNSLNLPILSTPADIAAALQIEIPRLRWLAYHAEATTVSHYVQFVVAKKSGGERTLSAPHQSLANAQRWIFENILQKLPVDSSAHGFIKERSIVTNAQPHIGAAVVINCDLTNFFPTITVHRVMGMFRRLGYSPAVATILALLVTECPRRTVLYNRKKWHVATGPRGLPQGACTSPAITNFICKRMDRRLHCIADKLGWTYTRYADDLTFSSRAASDRIGYLLARIRHITADEGFAVNEKKTRVLKKSARQTVTGVTVNTQLSTSRALRRRMRAIVHQAKKSGLEAQNRSNRKNFRAWLSGMIEFISMVNPKQGSKLREQMSSIK